MRQAALKEILEERVASSRNRRNPRAVKRKMSPYPRKRSNAHLPPIPDLPESIRIL